MIVADASVIANAIGDDADDGRRARDQLRAAGELAAPDLVDVVDVETIAALRKRWLAGGLSDQRFATAIGDLEEIELDRYPALLLMRRAYELRANVSAYNATYVALAETLACELLTADRKLSNAPGPRCPIRLLA